METEGANRAGRGGACLVYHVKRLLDAVFFWWARWDLNPQDFWSFDFKSNAYTNSATRPEIINGGTYGSCTHLRGFADRCVTAPPTRLAGTHYTYAPVCCLSVVQ